VPPYASLPLRPRGATHADTGDTAVKTF